MFAVVFIVPLAWFQALEIVAVPAVIANVAVPDVVVAVPAFVAKVAAPADPTVPAVVDQDPSVPPALTCVTVRTDPAAPGAA